MAEDVIEHAIAQPGQETPNGYSSTTCSPRPLPHEDSG
jgi:hypothetical protein